MNSISDVKILKDDLQPNTSAPRQPDGNIGAVYQVALLQSLTQGYFDGVIKVSELKRRGDTGLGTFDGVNGEMIVLDGRVYQALGNGSVRTADDNETVPFSVVTFFDKDISAVLPASDDINSLKESLTKIVDENGRNLFFMVKLVGKFKRMKVRSIPKQTKPYRSLDKALAADQKVYEYENISGTAVALYCPDYMAGLNASGWHLHFISDNKTRGGHILDLSFDSVQAEFDAKQSFELYLPGDPEFQSMGLSKDVSEAIRKVETNE